MLKSNKGFSLIEVMIASTIIFMVVTTFIPLISLIQMEREVLEKRRFISAYIHDELQSFLWIDKQLPQSYKATVQQKTVHLNFMLDGELVKGCGAWWNEKDIKENVCFYGISSE